MRKRSIISAVAIGVSAAPAAFAQQGEAGTQAVQTQAQTETQPQTQNEVLRRVQDSSELRSDWVRGTTVTTPDGETIGTIGDLLIDRETGEVTAAILSVGGFLGLGAKSIAVTWTDLELEYDASEITLALSREEAEAAPEFQFRDQDQPPPAGAGMGGGTGGTAGGTGGTGGTTAPPTPGR